MILLRWSSLASWPFAYYFLYVLVFLAVLFISVVMTKNSARLNELPIRAYNTYSCMTHADFKHDSPLADKAESMASSTDRTFRILDVFHAGTPDLADALCKDNRFAKRYDRVEAAWINRDQIDLRPIFQKYYDLMLAKPELLQRAELEGIPGYTAIARYANYSSQFISLDTKPELSTAYFSGKKLGLLDDPNSVSGYKIPSIALRRANIDSSQFDIIYYKSHLDLHQALHQREVDVIASFSWSAFNAPAQTSKNKSLHLQSQLAGPRWFLHPDLLASQSHCSALAALQGISSANQSTYLAKLTIIRGCQDDI